MDYPQLNAERLVHPEDFIAYANEESVSWRSRMFSYLTLDSLFPVAVVDAIQTVVRSTNPRYDDYMRGNGVDIADPKTQALLDQLEGAGFIEHAAAEQIRNLSRVTTRRCQSWGFDSVDAETLAAADRAEIAQAGLARIARRSAAAKELWLKYQRGDGAPPTIENEISAWRGA